MMLGRLVASWLVGMLAPGMTSLFIAIALMGDCRTYSRAEWTVLAVFWIAPPIGIAVAAYVAGATF